MRRILASILPLLAVCACTASDNGTIQLLTGKETDTFSAAPAPTKIVVYAVDTSGNRSTLTSASLPASNVDLGKQDETAIATLEVVATDASGNQVVAGASLPFQYGALAGGTLPIFVQRTGAFARLPSPPNDTRQAPTLADIAGEFLFIGGGSDPSIAAGSQIYDFGTFSSLSAPPALPRAPLSLAMVGTVGLVIDRAGATYFDFSSGGTLDVTAPSGFAFADVAGGQVLYGADSSGNLTDVYVVGATRTDGPGTAAVLHIDPNDLSQSAYPTGNLGWYTLTAPRLGAGATWTSGRGLVVTGGSPTAAGVELIAPATKAPATGSALAYPPDGSMGAGVAVPDQQHILVVGGVTPTGADAGVRRLDLGCAMSCGCTTPDCTGSPGTTLWGPGLPVPIASAAAFSLGGGTSAVVVGSEVTSGLTHAFVVTSTGATELALKVPHTNARAIQSPLGTVVVFGGAGELESFQPPL